MFNSYCKNSIITPEKTKLFLIIISKIVLLVFQSCYRKICRRVCRVEDVTYVEVDVETVEVTI